MCVRVACYLIFVSSRERERGEGKKKKKINRLTEIPPTETRQMKLQGQKLKGQLNQDRSLKATILFTFPNERPQITNTQIDTKTAQL